MAQLAIKGHATRGSEVIALLEMLGGINTHNLYGDESYAYYTIDSDKEIKGGIYVFGDENLSIFTLEQFEEKFPYKVGDEVWLHYENLTIRATETITCMRWCNKWNYVLYDVYTCGNLRESAFTPYKEETMEDKLEQIILDIPNGYEFFGINDDNKVVLTKKQPQYPKTYEECCEVLGHFTIDEINGYKAILLDNLQMLIICRDAYWKIAGEQMGLDKPWEPDWNHINRKFYCIYNSKNNIVKNVIYSENKILAFPIEEMCDAFYENFKELIEAVKELL